MKVLHVIPSLAAAEGGPSQAMLDIERALAARGIDVTIATTRGRCEDAGPPNPRRLAFARNTEFYKISIGLRRWLASHVGDYDLIHTHGAFSHAPIAAGFAARRLKVPYVVRPLGALRRYGMTRRRPLLKRLSLAALERRVLADAAAIQFTSAAEKADAEELGLAPRAIVIPLGVDTVSIAPAAERDRQRVATLLFLSRLDPIKNLEGLIRAWAQVAAECPGTVLKIAGHGEPNYVQSLRSLARSLGISDRVEWLGHVAGERKLSLLREATAFVLPSHSESFGIAAVEALSAGLPCLVAEGVAIATEIARADAGIVTEADPASLAQGLRILLGDAERRRAMSAAARRLAETNFSLDVMGARLEALYRELCRGNPGEADHA